MEKSQLDTTSDITKESYRGPSAAVAAIGHGAIEHLLYAVGGLVSLGALAYIFHKPAGKLIESARKLGSRLENYRPEGNRFIDRSADTLTNWTGATLHMIFGDVEAAQSLRKLSAQAVDPEHSTLLKNIAMSKEQGFGIFFITHTIGALPYVGKDFKNYAQTFSPRTNSAIAIGGIAGLAGYIGGWGKALIGGAKNGNQGQQQFERAQAEIAHLRETNDNLEKINDKLHEKVVEVSTKFKDAAEAEKALEPPAEKMDGAAVEAVKNPSSSRSQPSTSEDLQTSAPHDNVPASSTLHAAQHEGKLAPERAAEAAMV